jgi:endonuclease/exonuclease/phosphatase family metal-dependent hydrolase
MFSLNRNDEYNDFSESDLKAIQCYFHDLIISRAKELGCFDFINDKKKVLPIITNNDQIKKSWFPIPGMYGGFNYRLFTKNGKPVLLMNSWCRMDDGSLQNHEITINGYTLIKGKRVYKIVSWNCRFGFDKNKVEYIKKYLADIYIIQECTKDDIEFLKDVHKYCMWYGDNIDSKYGIGIFSNDFKMELLQDFNPDFRFVIPFKIYDENNEFYIFVVWTKDKDKNNKKIEYTEQTWNAINYKNYEEILSGNVILIGDFNSNNYWNKQYKQKKIPSHKDIINKLKEYKIESAYHKYYNLEDGNEKDATLFWQMDKNKRFHIDYCFISNNFKINNVQIENSEEWEKNKYSDHSPLIVYLTLL